MTSSPAGQPMPPGYFARLSDAEKLALYEEAAYALVSGQQRKMVRHENYIVEYQLASLPFIQRELARLRAIVGRRHGFTVGFAPINGNCHPKRF